MITVFVEPTLENFQYAPFDNSGIKGELADWLLKNTRGHWTWEHEPTQRGIGELAHWMLAFRFTNPDDAALFKLTWS